MLLFKGHFRSCITYPSGRTVWLPSFHNGIITATIDSQLDVAFRGGSAITSWYIGLIDTTDFTALSASDTMSSHSGWTENTDYSEGTRPEWAPGAASGGVLINAAAREYTISTAAQIEGLFVASDDTKGGTSGTLWAHGTYPTTQSLPVGAVFKAFYELRAREG